MSLLFAVMIGGALGSGSRYLVGLGLSGSTHFPLGTLTVNLLGCFMIGVLAT